MNRQHVIEITADSHGVRFDVYLKDDRNTLADIEMQTVSYPELPKRSRYYQSMMDLDVLERGSRYTELPQSYVILYEKLEREREVGCKEGLKEGREEGLAEGRTQGHSEVLFALVRDGILTRDEAAKRAENDFGIKQEEFLKLCEAMMNKC